MMATVKRPSRELILNRAEPDDAAMDGARRGEVEIELLLEGSVGVRVGL